VTQETARTAFSREDIESLRPAMKIGLLATIDDEGLPHVTLLSSLQAASATTLTFGQFIEGRGKNHLKKNARVGFLVMTLARQMWRGTAVFTGTLRSGPELDTYNQVPMFRYNAYFGIHTVFTFDLVQHGGREPLPTARIASAALATRAAAILSGSRSPNTALNPWTESLMNGMGNLKFAAFVGPDGFPRIVPIIQAACWPADRIIFSTRAFTKDLAGIPADVSMAVFGMTLKMEDVLLRGTYRGISRLGGFRCAYVDVDWVYNPMPPVPGVIYPPTPLSPVTDFTPAGGRSSSS